MCTRLTQTAKAFHDFQKRSGIIDAINFDINQFPTNQVSPSNRFIGIAAYDKNHRFLAITKWGTPIGDRLIFNARYENLGRSSLWSPSIQTQRILIPTDRFYEHGYAVRPEGQDSFVLAGITVLDPDGGHDAVAITKDSVGPVAKVHNRMPVVVPEALWEDWLSPTVPFWMFSTMFTRDQHNYDLQPLSNGKVA